jgi:hypothetical protein
LTSANPTSSAGWMNPNLPMLRRSYWRCRTCCSRHHQQGSPSAATLPTTKPTTCRPRGYPTDPGQLLGSSAGHLATGTAGECPRNATTIIAVDHLATGARHPQLHHHTSRSPRQRRRHLNSSNLSRPDSQHPHTMAQRIHGCSSPRCNNSPTCIVC